MIVVVGASSAIGKKLLPLLIERDEVLGASRSPDKLSEYIDSDRFQFEHLDLEDASSVGAFCDRIKAITERVTLLNLAAFKQDGLLLQVSSDVWKKTLETNVSSMLPIFQAALGQMMKNKWGRIINTSSIAVEWADVGAGAYCASKAALQSVTRTMAHEYARFGVTANTLVLGYFDAGLAWALNDETRNALINRIPSRCLGDPVDIIYAIDHIIKSQFLNGAEIRIDGGVC